MTVQRLSPRLPPTGVREVPVFPNGRSPRPLAWAVIVFALVPSLLALIADQAGLRIVMAALAGTVLVIGVSLLVVFGSLASRTVSIAVDASGLRFAPPAAASVPMLLIPIALLIPAVAMAAAAIAGLPLGATSLLVNAGPYVLGALGLGVLAWRLVQRRTPAGLALTPHGLRGIRGQGEVDWRWEDLAQVSVVAGPAAKLSLVPVGGGRPVLAPALALGSDPNLVAAIVDFYLDNPDERDALEGRGIDAVSRAEDALRR